MADATLDPIAATGPLIVEGPLADDYVALATLAALRPAQALYSTQAQCVVYGAARLVFGMSAVPVPPLRRIELDPQLLVLVNETRRRWRQSIDEARAS
jgi:hypothetical protein